MAGNDDRTADPKWAPETQLVHGGTLRSQFGETSEALFLTQGFVYKSAEQAEWLVESVAGLARAAQGNDADAVSCLRRAVINAAKRLGIVLHADDEIAGEAIAVIARLEAEIAEQQRAGSLKSVNRGYRDYRLEASARGEKVLRYADWMARYKTKLVRDIAHNLRAL